jgi:hypothetical protein
VSHITRARDRATAGSQVLQLEVESLLSWWMHELREVAEALLSRVAPRLVRPLVVRVEGDGLLVQGECATPEQLEVLRGSRAIGVIEPEHALAHELHLPASVERDMDRALDLYMERELPLPRDRMCVDWEVVRRDRAHHRIVVRLLAVHRERVERLRDTLASHGLRVVRIAARAPGDELLGRLQPRERQAARFRLTALDRRLAMAAAALAAITVCVVAGQWMHERWSLRGELATARELASRSASLTTRLREDSRPAVALAQLTRTPDAADVLIRLTETVPVDTWAYELEVKPEPSGSYQVKVGGFAPAATTLVDTLEKSPQFNQVRLISATSAGLGTTRDRLQLTAKWAKP